MDTPIQERKMDPLKSISMPPTSRGRGSDEAFRNSSTSRLNGEDNRSNVVTSPGHPSSPSKPVKLSSISPSAAMAPSRAGSVSWQQRPTSRGSTGARSRPLSMVASENNASKSPRTVASSAAGEENGGSRAQIAQSLASKDPSWFKQTTDRGIGSAAFRKNQEDEIPDTASIRSMRLPGMSRESAAEPSRVTSPSPESTRASSPLRNSSVRDNSSWRHRYSTSASVSSASGIRSPLPNFSSQRFEPPSETASSRDGDTEPIGRNLAMSPIQGRISPERMERPASPTKGLGGFVQSAMLKRSDSVNKRWSAQVGPGLSRGNSISSNRSGFDGPRPAFTLMSPPLEHRSDARSREQSPTATSRPSSSHSQMNPKYYGSETTKADSITLPDDRSSNSPTDSNFSKPSKPIASQDSFPARNQLNQDVKSPSSSPSKTMDSKRWSPSKASWLESAINKPDSPKPKAAAPQQPSWMTDLNKSRQNPSSGDKSSGFEGVSTGGLLRSPPMGISFKSPAIGGLPPGFSSGIVPRTRSPSPEVLAPRKDQPAETSLNVATSEPSTVSKFDSTNKLNLEPQRGTHPPPSTFPTTPLNSSLEENHSPPISKRELPSITKSKPETPPKKDFRSTLKPRHDSAGKNATAEPEFKNVFGKLKRTQTQNYVAPDELKDNIMRGKAGLALTGGPKKTERKDEFKESILKRKEEMKASTPPMTPRKPSSESMTRRKDPSTPEAIAKTGSLTRSESGMSNGKGGEEKSSELPEAFAKRHALREKLTPPAKQDTTAAHSQSNVIVPSKLADRFNPALLTLIARGPSPMAGTKPSAAKETFEMKSQTSLVPDIVHKPSKGGSQLTHMTKSRARGPKRRLPTADTAENIDQTNKPEPSNKPDAVTPSESQAFALRAELKPKPQPVPRSVVTPEPRPLANITNSNNKSFSPTSPQKTNIPTKKLLDSRAKSKSPPTSKHTSPAKENSKAGTMSLEEKAKVFPNQDVGGSAETHTITPRPLPTLPVKTHDTVRLSEKPAPTIVSQNSKESESQKNEQSVTSVRSAAALWAQSPPPDSRSPQPREPIKLPTRKDEQAAYEHAGLQLVQPTRHLGLGISTNPEEDKSGGSTNRGPSFSPPESPKSPPIPARKPQTMASRIVSNGAPPNSIPDSSISKSSETRRLLGGVFSDMTLSKSKAQFDTQAILASRSSNDDFEKIKTLWKRICEVTGDGKMLPVPSHLEHILFDKKMYLCTHVFGSVSGTRTTEIYLWCGDGVSPSAADDAQLFARKVAKENNGKLVILKQGKETSNFFQALGGIVIMRCGSGSRVDASSAPASYMLCGRQHVGQIAFDEVNFSAKSLCSAFPYIVSARTGKLFLWKGKGAGADELGCSRLIGMDLGLTGEIEEVEQGNEPLHFWNIFPDGQKGVEAEMGHWNLKPSCEKYTTRLFIVDLDTRPKSSSGFKWGRRGSATPSDVTTTVSIREIVPFAQSDISSDGIYVLDTFFETFV